MGPHPVVGQEGVRGRPDHQRARGDGRHEPGIPDARSRGAGASCPRTASTSGTGSGGTRQPYLLRPPEDGVLAMAGVCGRCGRTPRPACGCPRPRSSPPPRTRPWAPSTTACRCSCRATPGSGGSTRRLDDPGELQGLLVPAPDDVLVMVPVSKAVNNVRNDRPDAGGPRSTLGHRAPDAGGPIRGGPVPGHAVRLIRGKLEAPGSAEGLEAGSRSR